MTSLIICCELTNLLTSRDPEQPQPDSNAILTHFPSTYTVDFNHELIFISILFLIFRNQHLIFLSIFVFVCVKIRLFSTH